MDLYETTLEPEYNTSVPWSLMEDNATSLSLSEEKLMILSSIDIATSILSILGSASILISSVRYGKPSNPEVHPIFHLSLADFLASLSLLIGAALYLDGNTPDGVCLVITGLTTRTFFGVTFFLTLCYAVQVYVQQRRKRYAFSMNQSRCRKWLVVLYSFCWLAPLLFESSVLITHGLIHEGTNFTKSEDIDCSTCLPIFHYNEDKCYKVHHVKRSWRYAYKLVFLIPLTLVMFSNAVLYALAIREYRASEAARGILTKHQYEVIKQMKKKSTLYLGVFVFCWLPSMVLGFISLQSYFNMNTFFSLYLIQSFTTPLQGFLNSLIYGWQRKAFVNTLLSGSDDNNLSTSISGSYGPTYQTFSDTN